MSERIYDFIITIDGKENRKFSFVKGVATKIVIGKNKDIADVVVEQSFVSRKHLELYKDENDHLFVTDLNSTNGVFVNNKKINAGERYRLSVGDILSFMKSSTVQLLVQYSNRIKNNTVVTSAGGDRILDVLNKKKKITVGRSSDCDVTLDSGFASRTHAIIERQSDGSVYISDNGSTNGTYVNNKLISGRQKISENDVIKIGRIEFTLLTDVLLDNVNKPKSQADNSKLVELLKAKGRVVIGRSEDADITIKDNVVSRRHAQITHEGDNYFIRDLNSTNGVFVNGKRIRSRTQITANDEIRIGLSIFRIDDNLNIEAIEQDMLTAIRAEEITKKFSNGHVGVQPMSFTIPARSFVALMGPSGCGKTTLMNMLNGANPATGGRVYIHGLDLIRNYDLLKQKIGYVPQDDIVHRNLTVNKSLYYAAKLRMNEDTTDKEIWQRIDEVCTNLNINDKEIRENKVKNLSGGQRKRVSIAVELLNNPSVLFLDEPTSPLDPETIDGFLKSIKELTVKENTTVIMVTHKPSDLHYADKIIFLAKKGYPAYYGGESKLYSYFGVEEKNIIEIYSLLGKNVDLTIWYRKWKEEHKPAVKAKEDPSSVSRKGKNSLIRQFRWLTGRYANIKINDPGNMAILMAQPLIIPIALIYIFSELQLGILFMMAVSAIWFGVSNAAKEIVEELPVYTRERMFNLNIITYILSKLLVLSVIALMQVAVFVLVLKMKFSGGEIELVNIGRMIGFMFYLTVSATLLGLSLSAFFKNSEQVMSIIPIVLIPQIIFAGVIATIDTKDKEVISYMMLGRWGTEGLARIQNDYPAYKNAGNTNSDYVVTENNNNTAVPINKGTQSVFEKIPASNSEGYILVKSDPLKTLGFYENKKLINAFDSLEKNILAITLINILIFILLYRSLKSKDKIKITN